MSSPISVVRSQKQETRGRTFAEWDGLVHNIRVGDKAALEELYRICRTVPASMLAKSLPPAEVDDAIQNLYLASLVQIRRGDLKDSSSLVAYLVTIARRQVCLWIAGRVREPFQAIEFNLENGDALPSPAENMVSHYPGPDYRYSQSQRMALAHKVLSQLSKRGREILDRFYVLEQSPEQIQREMGLSPTQFRLAKSRAKAKAATIAQQVLRPSHLLRKPQTIARPLVRTLAAA